MWLEKWGIRKLIMGLFTGFLVGNSEPPKGALAVGIYACFCLANMIEHWSQKPKALPPAPPAITTPDPVITETLSQIMQGMEKVFESQQAQTKALNYIVQYIQANQVAAAAAHG